MAAIWKGSVAFGLVNIPVELRTAVRADHISFRLLHQEDLSPVKYERVCQARWRANSLERLRQGRRDRSALLRDAVLSRSGQGSREVVCSAARSHSQNRRCRHRQDHHSPDAAPCRDQVIGDALVLEIMRFSNDLVDADEYTFPSRSGVRPQELQMAEQLIENLASPFDPSRYTDDYHANLMKLIKAKMKGKKIKLEEPEKDTAETGVLDLMSRLRASLDQGSGKKTAKAKRAAPAKEGARSTKRKTA